jgi:hypothetical protein
MNGGDTIAKRYDWDYYRHKYVTGGENVTLESLSNQPNAPKLNTLAIRSGKENWAAQKREYLNQVSTKALESSSSTEAEVAARHVKIARSLQAKALARLQQMKPDELSPRDLLAFLKDATEIERKALGLEQLTLHLKGGRDVTKLSDDELDALAQELGITGGGRKGAAPERAYN